MAEDKRKYWQESIERCKKSGLSQQKYCQEKNLNYNTFKYWTVKINKEGKTEMGLTKLPLQYSSSGNAFEIITRNNFRIRTKELFSEAALKKLIEVVEQL